MYTINQLDEFIRGFKCIESLVEIGRLSKDLFNRNKVFENIPVKIGRITTNQTVTQWGLAFLGYRLIMSSNDFRSKVLSPIDLARVHSIYNELDEPFIHDYDIFSFFFRISQEQLW